MNEILMAVIIGDDTESAQNKIDSLLDCPLPHITTLIIDDGSDFEMPSIDNDSAHFFKHEAQLGFGGSFVTALTFARHYLPEYLFMLPIEEFYSWQTVAGYIQHLNAAEVISGNRLLNAADYGNYKILADSFCVQTGLRIMDPCSPIKGLSMKHIELFEITEFTEASFIQFLIQAAHYRLTIKEFDCAGSSTPRDLAIGNGGTLDFPEEFIKAELHLYPIIKQEH